MAAEYVIALARAYAPAYAHGHGYDYGPASANDSPYNIIFDENNKYLRNPSMR